MSLLLISRKQFYSVIWGLYCSSETVLISFSPHFCNCLIFNDGHTDLNNILWIQYHHCNINIMTGGTLQGPNIHLPLMSVHVSFVCSSFFPRSNDIRVYQTGDTKLSMTFWYKLVYWLNLCIEWTTVSVIKVPEGNPNDHILISMKLKVI